MHIRLHSESEIAFSTPRPDPILGTLTSLLGQVAGRDVYVNAGGLWSPIPWIYSSAAVAALSAIDIEGGELLTVTGGGPFALVHSAGIDSDWRRLQQLVALARLLPNGTSQESLEPLSLPEELRDLVSLLSRWAISDDGERSDLVESAETADLRDLVDRVQPRLPRIAKFLGEAKDHTEQASALEALAQSAMEAAHELKRRSGRGA